jgi:membrane-associated phospholipid phosphatase
VSAQTPAAPAVEAEPCDQFGFLTLFRCILHDAEGVANRRSLVSLGSGAALAAGSLLLDDEANTAMRDADPDPPLAAGEVLGHAGVHFGAPLAVYAIARATGKDEVAAFSVALLRTQVLNAAVTRGFKLIPRARPYQESATLTKGSFPSGHTSAMFATSTVLQRRWGWRAGVPAYLLSAYVGATRLQNKHYLSDVMFGAAVGMAVGLVVDFPRNGPAIAPIVRPGAAGVAVSVDLGPSAD